MESKRTIDSRSDLRIYPAIADSPDRGATSSLFTYVDPDKKLGLAWWRFYIWMKLGSKLIGNEDWVCDGVLRIKRRRGARSEFAPLLLGPWPIRLDQVYKSFTCDLLPRVPN